MKKFIGIIILLINIQLAYSQCSLGGDKVVFCGDKPIDLNVLFNTNATFTTRDILPPNDTTYGSGGIPDTVRYLARKFVAIATLPNGCIDSAIVRIPIRVYPLPNLGQDTTLYLAVQQEVTSILSFSNNLFFSINGYNNHNWIPNSPGMADTGKYLLTVVTHDGCIDERFITVACAKVRDTTVKKMCS